MNDDTGDIPDFILPAEMTGGVAGHTQTLQSDTSTHPSSEPEEVTATVSEIKDAALALIGPLPKEFDRVAMAKMARDVAMDIKERHVVLKEHGLSEVQFEYLSENNSYFKGALETAIREWQSPMSSKERLAITAAAILEDSLPTLGARMQSRAEGLPGVIEAAKFFAKAAGVGERDTNSGPIGERFVINIDLGGDTKLTVEAGENPNTLTLPVVKSD